MKHIIRRSFTLVTFICCLCIMSGCKKFLDVPLPTDRFPADAAYENDVAAGAVLTGIIYSAATNTAYGLAFNNDGIGFCTGLYADDLTLLRSPLTSISLSGPYFINQLSSDRATQWPLLYRQIYSCNLAIDNLEKYRSNLNKYDQWMGEALFMRGMAYFDLVNLYGDVPLAISADYTINNALNRSAKNLVYAQIIKDLRISESLLGEAYLDGTGNASINRVRPNQFAAAALLARVYLYTGDYSNAALKASKVIENGSLYQLLPLSSVFLANSKETIWALAPPTTAAPDYYLYNNLAMPILFDMASMSESLATSFEPGDQRFIEWTSSRKTTDVPAKVLYFPAKYKSKVSGVEFNVLMRLAEQYLIRAEARAMLNNTTESVSDINVIRQRARPLSPAGLMPDYPQTLSTAECITAILKERRSELFSEFGHRFYDLKRLGLIDQVMTLQSPLKGGTWSAYKQYWPILADDIEFNKNLTQTPGYN